ncbi:MAG: single-stranded DNA-binding protein [Terrimicrobiaceae bacterium]|nr:single-stranded DNA-binding protein [Terrimicrobiaceae bacterium]
MLETIVVGNVGSVRFARAGETSVLNVSVASSRKINEREYTDWISAKLWGTRGEKLRERISVGMKILIRGRPEAKGFQKGDGTVSGELVVHINDLEFLNSRPKLSQAEQLPLEAPPASKPKKRKSAAG